MKYEKQMLDGLYHTIAALVLLFAFDWLHGSIWVGFTVATVFTYIVEVTQEQAKRYDFDRTTWQAYAPWTWKPGKNIEFWPAIVIPLGVALSW